jgi:hypothetical protein
VFRLHTKLLDESPSHGVDRRGCGARVANTLPMIGLFVALWLGAATASAQVWTVPSDLSLGAKYRLVFVTEGKRYGTGRQLPDGSWEDGSNIQLYNDFVTAQAASSAILPLLATEWKAIASTATKSARDNTSTNFTDSNPGLPVYKLVIKDGKYTGERIADSYKDLWDGAIAYPISVTQNFATVPDGFTVWTGTLSNGLSATNAALGQLPISSGLKGQTKVGSAEQTNYKWIAEVDQNNEVDRRFYAISGELTAIPEPSTLGLGFALAVAGAAWSVRRRNRKAEPSADTASL